MSKLYLASENFRVFSNEITTYKVQGLYPSSYVHDAIKVVHCLEIVVALAFRGYDFDDVVAVDV